MTNCCAKSVNYEVKLLSPLLWWVLEPIRKLWIYSVSQKILPPEVFWNFFQTAKTFKAKFKKKITRPLYVHIYGKLQNFIQLSLNLTLLLLLLLVCVSFTIIGCNYAIGMPYTLVCHIKCNHSVNFHFSLYRLHRTVWMATKFTRPQPTWLSCVRCNASGISQTSLKAQRSFRS